MLQAGHTYVLLMYVLHNYLRTKFRYIEYYIYLKFPLLSMA
jgi:hypothetical protein